MLQLTCVRAKGTLHRGFGFVLTFLVHRAGSDGWRFPMRYRKLFLAAALLLVNAAASLTNAQCTRCCFPFPNISVNPAITLQNQAVTVTTTVVNCRPYRMVITAKVSVSPESGCTSFAEAFSLQALIPGFESRTLTYTFPAPKCNATYQVKESSSNATGTATKTLTVR